MDRETFDGRFLKDTTIIKEYFCEWILGGRMNIEQLKMIMKAAEKLNIDPSEPAVDVLYEIASRLSILEAEIISPKLIMDKIKEFLENN